MGKHPQDLFGEQRCAPSITPATHCGSPRRRAVHGQIGYLAGWILEGKPMRTVSRTTVPALTTEQMRAVDRAMVEDLHIELVQMMENAGRNLAELAITRFSPAR
jgi:hypothetical protein